MAAQWGDNHEMFSAAGNLTCWIKALGLDSGGGQLVLSASGAPDEDSCRLLRHVPQGYCAGEKDLLPLGGTTRHMNGGMVTVVEQGHYG
ncbi:hypothetical protein O988_05302 [Pseudogymnoascus sp. VKM F-3808]|nr:hypothetical protein O988_05302 [Pseudogymnoascus sp. VKM F-3808]